MTSIIAFSAFEKNAEIKCLKVSTMNGTRKHVSPVPTQSTANQPSTQTVRKKVTP